MADDIAMDIDRYSFRILTAATATLLAAGTIFFHEIEKWSWLNSYYFCVVTLSTVGYGDVVPHTAFGKFGTTIYIMIGVGIIAAFFQATARRQERRRQNKFGKRNANKNES